MLLKKKRNINTFLRYLTSSNNNRIGRGESTKRSREIDRFPGSSIPSGRTFVKIDFRRAAPCTTTADRGEGF